MRFVKHIICAGLLGQIALLNNFSDAYAQIPASISEVTNLLKGKYTDLTLPAKSLPPRLQKGQRVDKLQAIEGLKVKRFARRLGNIQSMSRGAQGQLYTTDARTGRVFIIPDIDQNGKPEQIRALPYRFDNPSAAIELGEHIYIADRQALWKLPKARTSFQDPKLLANLTNIQSRGAYFLTLGVASPDKAPQLTLGYSSQDGQARLISVDTQTGHADLIREAAGRLEQLAPMAGSKPWLVYRSQDGLHMGTSFEGSTALGQALDIHGIALPKSDQSPDNWPKSLRNHILISRGNPVNVTAMPSALGAVLPQGREIFSGFQNGRTAWGQAGALHMDKRGLFIADPYNGDIWRVYGPLEAQDKAGTNNIDRVLDNLKAAQIKAETPLKRDPLKGAYDTRFPISGGSKNTPEKGSQSDNNPAPPIP